MDIDNLNAFISVSQNQSFSKAADELHITQSAVSKRIQGLESELNCALFDRVGRQIRLTQAGDILLQRALLIVRQIEDTKNQIKDLSGSLNGKVSIATSHHIGLYHLPNILKSFSAEYPEIELDMHFTDSELAYQDVLQGQVDIAIATLPQKHSDKSLQHIHLWTDDLVIVCNQDHKLATIKNPDFKTLSQYPAILPGFETFTRRIINQIFEKHNVKLKLSFTTNYLETIKVMVESGLGWSVLPENMLNSQLKRIKLSNFKAQRKLGIILNSKHTLSNAAQCTVDYLIKPQ